jgi:succinate dehydrogenase / fumarate reductase membrane anchor subunit
MRSPLGRVLGLGSSKTGYAHWWGQRLSAAALAPLGLWFAANLPGLLSADYWAAVAWVSEPLHAILLILLLATLLYHSSLGLRVIVEDYVHHGPAKVITIVLMDFIHVALGSAAIYSIVMLSFGGFA